MKSTVIPKYAIILVGAGVCLIAAPEVVLAEELPSMEFLEYLGEWETEEGDWIDPAVLAENNVIESVEAEFVYTAEEKSDEQ